MPWPAQLLALLNAPESPPSQALRWSLQALKGTLQAAVDECPSDPSAPSARDLISELDSLLAHKAPSKPVAAPPSPQNPVRASAESSGRQLAELAQAMSADDTLRSELGAAHLPDADDPAAWGLLQRRLLRVSPTLAHAWRQRSQQAVERLGAISNDSRVQLLPFPNDRVLYPGLEGSITATGLRTCPTATLDPRVAPHPADADLPLLARLVSTALWFIENDPELHHCLQSVYRFGVVPLVADQRNRFVDEMLRRWRRVRDRYPISSPTPPKPWLKDFLEEHIALDEAFNSLVHVPPAAPDSWWGAFQAQARPVLNRARDLVIRAGCPARLQRLAGDFPAVSNLVADDSLQVPHGTPGEIVACLRVYARIDGHESKARVLYRSL